MRIETSDIFFTLSAAQERRDAAEDYWHIKLGIYMVTITQIGVHVFVVTTPEVARLYNLTALEED